MFNKFVLLSLCLIINVLSQTRLSGDVSGRVLSVRENIYIVEDNISVESGKKLVIEEGSILLFSPFTGLTVYGSLEVNGTDENPVIFTSLSDTAYNPQSQILANPFDWNGILIHARASQVVLKNFKLSYSVYGIKSQREDVSIMNGLFFQNGQFHFTVNEKIMPVADGIPYSCGSAVTDSTKDINSDKHGKSRKMDILIKKIVPAAIGAAGVGSGVVSLVFLGKWNDLRDEYHKEANPSKRDNIKNDGKRFSQIAAGTGAFSIAAIATGAVLFWNWNLREKKSAEVIPLFVPGAVGVAVSVNLR